MAGTQTGSYDFKADREAAKVAKNYIAEVSNGVFVHAEGTPSDPANANAKGVKITDVIDIIRDGISAAMFGQTSRIGEEGSAHLSMADEEITLVTANGTVAFHIASSGAASEGTLVSVDTYKLCGNHDYSSDSMTFVVDDLTNAIAGSEIKLLWQLGSDLTYRWQWGNQEWSSFTKGTSKTISKGSCSIAYNGNKTFTVQVSAGDGILITKYTYFVKESLPLAELFGVIKLSLDVDESASKNTAATAGNDKDLFNAIRTLGWYDDVIV